MSFLNALWFECWAFYNMFWEDLHKLLYGVVMSMIWVIEGSSSNEMRHFNFSVHNEFVELVPTFLYMYWSYWCGDDVSSYD